MSETVNGGRYVASFQPEAWINDYAVPVDPEGETEWDCTAFVDAGTLTYLMACAVRRHEDLDDPTFGVVDNDDVFKRDPAAPAWVRDWRGPFTIRVRRERPEPEIAAEAHADDFAVQVEFDAQPFFAQASDEQLLALAECAWGGDYPADEVAQFFASGVHELPDVISLFDYLASQRSTRNAPGFECYVHEADALAWLAAQRPRLHAQITGE